MKNNNVDLNFNQLLSFVKDDLNGIANPKLKSIIEGDDILRQIATGIRMDLLDDSCSIPLEEYLIHSKNEFIDFVQDKIDNDKRVINNKFSNSLNHLKIFLTICLYLVSSSFHSSTPLSMIYAEPSIKNAVANVIDLKTTDVTVPKLDNFDSKDITLPKSQQSLKTKLVTTPNNDSPLLMQREEKFSLKSSNPTINEIANSNFLAVAEISNFDSTETQTSIFVVELPTLPQPKYTFEPIKHDTTYSEPAIYDTAHETTHSEPATYDTTHETISSESVEYNTVNETTYSEPAIYDTTHETISSESVEYDTVNETTLFESIKSNVLHEDEPNLNKAQLLKDETIVDLTSFPNPFIDKIKVKFTANPQSNYHVQLLDPSGKILSEGNNMQQFTANKRVYEFNRLSNLSKGIYIISVFNNEGSFLKSIKTVKQ